MTTNKIVTSIFILLAVGNLLMNANSQTNLEENPELADHPICIPIAAEWNAVTKSSNLRLMEEVLADIPPICGSLIERANNEISQTKNLLLDATEIVDVEQTISKLTACDVCPQMVSIPAGEFRMGSPMADRLSIDNERPTRTVTVKPMMVSATEITFDNWNECVLSGGCEGYQPSDEGWGRGQYPVINVNWYDAQSYLTWLSQRAGLNFRLLSEAEWEYVARANSTTPFFVGERVEPSQANFDSSVSFNNSRRSEPLNRADVVGKFPPNQFGLSDTMGNVLEWTEDCFTDSYFGGQSSSEPNLLGDCERRMIRGGSWSSAPEELRSGKRFAYPAEVRTPRIGFRIALGLQSEVDKERKN